MSSKQGKGEVYLVGAGPGDPGLITVRGIGLLRKADVIVHDSLIPAEVLSIAREECEVINVGKRGGRHLMEQEEINAILSAKAKEGRMVVRLKGGDPFLFGRGGEEAEALRAEGVEVHVVPGVTSAIAVPALAGIAVWHRVSASSVTFVTGHEAADKEKEILNWKALSSVGGTLVILMGASGLERNARRMLEGGMDPQTPVAVIERGATPDQRVFRGVLADIAVKCREAGIGSPAIIVVGEVVRLMDRLGDLR